MKLLEKIFTSMLKAIGIKEEKWVKNMNKLEIILWENLEL